MKEEVRGICSGDAPASLEHDLFILNSDLRP